MNQKVKAINVITLGNSFVGKTSLIKRIKDGQFDENVKTTISIDCFSIQRPYDKKNMTISLNFRDTSGYEMYQYILPKQYIHDSHIVLLVFDSIETLNDLIVDKTDPNNSLIAPTSAPCPNPKNPSFPQLSRFSFTICDLPQDIYEPSSSDW